MKRYLLDTNAAAHCIFRRKGVHERVKTARADGNRIGIAVPALGELFGGVEYSSTREKNLDILERNFRLFTLWPFTLDAAKIYGKIFAELRRKGRLIQQIDMQIAAIALSLGNCTVVTSDSDFSVVSGLTVENWASS
jgi:tRNA(fMet)-specific endonuclease VapC